jgi:alpha-beta hydrolase superfamily lysophospholipase
VADKRWRLLVYLFWCGLAVLIMLAWMQRLLIYHPTKSKDLAAQNAQVPQAVVDVQVTTHDNLKLNGWLALAGEGRFAKAPDIAKSLSQGRPLVIVFPGNGGPRAMRQYLLQALGSLGADVMIFDHRGFGDNPGKPTEWQLTQDAQAIWKYATEELKVPPQRIVLYGESLGGGVASRLAGDLGAKGVEPGGLVIQASFDSLVSAGKYHFPILPVSLILIDRFESAKYIAKSKCPILHLHGELDRVVPITLGKRLFQAAPEKSTSGVPKQLVVLPRTNHNDVFGPDLRLVMTALKDFLAGVETHAKVAPKAK